MTVAVSPLTVGATLPSWHLDAVSAEKMKTFALVLHDPNPIHLDAASARQAGMPGVVNQGPSNMAMAANAVMAAFPAGRITRLQLRLLGLVMAGDAVEVSGEVIAAKTDGPAREITCAVRLRANGQVRLEGEADVRVPSEDECHRR